jgi:DNA-binding PadR family transcriptional regulator
VPPKSNDINDFLPLKPLDFQLLTVLAGRELHGYGIVQAVKEQFPDQPALELGSLYRIIGRMLDTGLITEVKPPKKRHADRRVRRYYAITDLGLRVVRAEASRMRSLLAAPATRELEV